ncbi:MAG: hypothetical protein WBX38_11290 [Candidatus Sulfotelmatobacter sp.]
MREIVFLGIAPVANHQESGRQSSPELYSNVMEVQRQRQPLPKGILRMLKRDKAGAAGATSEEGSVVLTFDCAFLCDLYVPLRPLRSKAFIPKLRTHTTISAKLGRVTGKQTGAAKATSSVAFQWP